MDLFDRNTYDLLDDLTLRVLLKDIDLTVVFKMRITGFSCDAIDPDSL